MCGIELHISDLIWQSDWDGHEVGYPELGVVSLWTSNKLECDFFIHSECNKIIEVMPHFEE